METARGKRDRAILALLVGCGLRRAELVNLKNEDFQLREDHWVVGDLIGKGKHIRTVPAPGWVKRAVDDVRLRRWSDLSPSEPTWEGVGRGNHAEGNPAHRQSRG